MKKIITLISIFILSTILLSSCKSGFVSSKRHYTKGYYFAKNHNRTAPGRSESKDVLVKAGYSNQMAEVKMIAEQTPVRTNTRTGEIPNSKPLLVNNEEQRNKEVKMASLPSKMYKLENKNDHKALINLTQLNIKKATDGPVREVLSLFWIVIVVILILWLIGLLAGGWGLGGLINLLLVIALILLILWLLRVI